MAMSGDPVTRASFEQSAPPEKFAHWGAFDDEARYQWVDQEFEVDARRRGHAAATRLGSSFFEVSRDEVVSRVKNLSLKCLWLATCGWDQKGSRSRSGGFLV